MKLKYHNDSVSKIFLKDEPDILLPAFSKCFDKVIKEDGKRFIKPIFDDRILKEVKSLGKTLKKRFENLFVVGIGGSALGGIALKEALLGDTLGNTIFMDNVDPYFVKDQMKKFDLSKTLINVVSKSGKTIETAAHLFTIEKMLKDQVKNPYLHLLITTDPDDNPLRTFAKEKGIPTLNIPKEMGGRFSVLSPVGLFPAYFMGIDVDELIEGARSTYKSILKDEEILYMSVAFLYLSSLRGKKMVIIMPYSNRLWSFALWYRQLFAESLGKRFSEDGHPKEVGQTPVCALGVVDQHSQLQLYREGPKDKIVMFLTLEESVETPKIEATIKDFRFLEGKDLFDLLLAEKDGTEISLIEAGVPTFTISLEKLSPFHIGSLIIFFELQVAVLGRLYNINPYDQPGVELGKKISKAILDESDKSEFKMGVIKKLKEMKEVKL